MDMANSVSGVPIRLSYERWFHIVENHDDLASYFHEVLDTVERPDCIVRGNRGALKAARNLGRKKWLVVVYRELYCFRSKPGQNAKVKHADVPIMRLIQ